MINPFPLKNKPFETFPHVGGMWPPYNVHSPQARGLVGWWPTLASRSGIVLRDLINSYNGTINTGVSRIFSPLAGQGLEFDGVDGFIQVADTPRLRLDTLTVSAWCILNNINKAQKILRKGDSSGASSNYQIMVLGGNQFRFSVYNSGGGQVDADSSATLAADTLYHLAGTYNGNDLLAFINAQQDGSNTQVSINSASTTDIYIGHQEQATPLQKLDGQIFDVRIYNRALSASEIWQLYDPATRWELYQPQTPRFIMSVTAEVASMPYPSKMHPSRNQLLRM